MQLFPMLFASLSALAVADAQLLFHGTSVMIKPLKGRYPSNAKYETANFYCYFSLEHLQYVSFGWFLGGNPEDIDHSKCHARPESYDWWEYSTSANCTSDGKQCRVHAMNFLTEHPSEPFIDDEYVVLQPFAIGHSASETLYVSYFDRPGGAHAVGSRKILEGKECSDAFKTIKTVAEEKNVPLGFNFTNPCGGTMNMGTSSQKILL
ncbi:hypothetical protein TWF696_000219 [Orbilia brochopaga]|uniref:Uncharacterized protein n=1 Tax=Orbilia brochopaga TaxID=3140254 RepID=A0AAV9VB18_9PEZI